MLLYYEGKTHSPVLRLTNYAGLKKTVFWYSITSKPFL
jgi:hypothetical protein